MCTQLITGRCLSLSLRIARPNADLTFCLHAGGACHNTVSSMSILASEAITPSPTTEKPGSKFKGMMSVGQGCWNKTMDSS